MGIIALIVGGIIVLCCGLQIFDSSAWMDAENKWYWTFKDAVLTIVVPLVVAIMLFYVGYKMVKNEIVQQ